TRLSRCATTTEASVAARPRFRTGVGTRPPGSGPGVVSVPPPRSVWTEGLEPPTPGFRRRCARQIAPRPGGTDGRIRTDTDGGLSAVPLPVGLRQQGGPCGTPTRSLLLAAELRYQLRHRPIWSRERDSYALSQAYETLLMPGRP